MSFPDRLRLERERLGVSQTAFGRLGGVTKITQWNYEAGKHWPTLDYIETLRATGKVDVVFLVTGSRSSRGELDWPLLKNAFLFAQRSFSQRPDRTFSDEQLFDLFKSVVETSLRFTGTTPGAKSDESGAEVEPEVSDVVRK